MNQQERSRSNGLILFRSAVTSCATWTPHDTHHPEMPFRPYGLHGMRGWSGAPWLADPQSKGTWPEGSLALLVWLGCVGSGRLFILITDLKDFSQVLAAKIWLQATHFEKLSSFYAQNKSRQLTCLFFPLALAILSWYREWIIEEETKNQNACENLIFLSKAVWSHFYRLR